MDCASRITHGRPVFADVPLRSLIAKMVSFCFEVIVFLPILVQQFSWFPLAKNCLLVNVCRTVRVRTYCRNDGL
jgi:hypothetical protein